MNYKFQLDMFEGPLDLLLYLIRKNEVDICNIPVAKITEQYLEYMELMKMLDLDGIGEFLVMAATLLQIKSRMLLPPDPGEKVDHQDPRAELVRRLEEYQQIKEAAEQLRLRAETKGDLFPRRIDQESLAELKEDSREVFFEANLFDLVTALTAALKNKPEQDAYEVVREEHTVEKKVHYILHSLISQSRLRLNDLFSLAEDKIEVIVTFMAVLELCRVKEVVVVQKRLFSDIELLRNTQNITVIQPPVDEPGEEPQPTQDESDVHGRN